MTVKVNDNRQNEESTKSVRRTGCGTRVINHSFLLLALYLVIDMLWHVPKINSSPGVWTKWCYSKFWRHLISLQTAALYSLNRVLWWKVLWKDSYLSAPQENNCLQTGTASDGHSLEFKGQLMQELTFSGPCTFLINLKVKRPIKLFLTCQLFIN